MIMRALYHQYNQTSYCLYCPFAIEAITKNLISVAKKEGGHRAYGGDMGSFTYYNKTYTPQQLILNLYRGNSITPRLNPVLAPRGCK